MKKIKFTYLSEYGYNVCERPKPSSNYIPDWFKEMPPYVSNDDKRKSIFVFNSESNATAKKCVPMRDAISSGYTVPLWSDVLVSREDDIPNISWRVSRNVFNLHENYGASKIPPPIGYDNVVFKYITNFRVNTPKGYSIMIKPVSGYYQPPFIPIPGIIDSDKSVIDTNIPVWVRSDLSGVVLKGTPIAQIFPFKREDWESEFDYISEDKYRQELDKDFQSNIINNYIKNIWSKKKYI